MEEGDQKRVELTLRHAITVTNLIGGPEKADLGGSTTSLATIYNQ